MTDTPKDVRDFHDKYTDEDFELLELLSRIYELGFWTEEGRYYRLDPQTGQNHQYLNKEEWEQAYKNALKLKEA